MSYSSLASALQLSPSLWDLSREPFVVFPSHDELKTAHCFSKCLEAINVEFSAEADNWCQSAIHLRAAIY